MTEKRKKVYKAPELTVVTFKAERGYAGSNDLRFLWIGLWLSSGNAGNANGVENYTLESHDNW